MTHDSDSPLRHTTPSTTDGGPRSRSRTFGNRYLLASIGESMLAGLRTRLYDHLQSLPLAFYHERRRGEVHALLANDAARIASFVTTTLVSLLPLMVTFLGALYFLFRIDGVIAAIALVIVPVFYVAIRVDLAIARGETVALTGENGAGKSTVVHLLMRFADPDRGQVLMDGGDLREVTIASLRRQVGLVAQAPLLLNGTIRDNIAFSRPEASLEEVVRSAEAERASDFVAELPEGYDTVIGDQGVRLSGGQRHRIALARALLGDPPVLILDEATAMFDPEGERAFLEECREVFETRTVLLITHRPASLAMADRVLRLEAGRVAPGDTITRRASP